MANLTTVGLTSGAGSSGTGNVSTLDNLIGTAGTASTNVLSVQGIASGVAQPVSGTVTAAQATAASLNATVVQGTAANLNMTEANSATIASSVLSQGSTTSGQKGELAMGAVTTSAPTYITAQTSPLSLDTAGNLRVNVAAGGGSGGTSSTFGSTFPGTGTAIGLTNGTNMVGWSATTNYGTAPASIAVPAVNSFVTNANSNGQATMANSAPVTIASNQASFPVTIASATTGGLSTSKLIAAASTNATSLKASAGTLYGCQVFNNSTTLAYLKFYNKASAPTVGTDTPVKVIMIPASSGAVVTFPPQGVAFGTGIAYAVTGGIADADTTTVAATEYAINIDYA